MNSNLTRLAIIIQSSYIRQYSKKMNCLNQISTMQDPNCCSPWTKVAALTKIAKPKQKSATDENDKPFSGSKTRESQSYDTQVWKRTQIQSLFRLYDCHGSQWKIISQRTPNRSANNLKNRFYTVLRNLAKLLFSSLGQACPKRPGQIASKDLCRLYDGKQDYSHLGGIIRSILQDLNYNLGHRSFGGVAKKYAAEIQQVYQAIYKTKPKGEPDQKTIASLSPQELQKKQASGGFELFERPTGLERGSSGEDTFFHGEKTPKPEEDTLYIYFLLVLPPANLAPVYF